MKIKNIVAISIVIAGILCVAIPSISFGQEKKTKELYSIREKLTTAIIENLKFCKRHTDKVEMISPSCTGAPEGCRQRIELLVEHTLRAAYVYDLDPYLLAAVLFNESRFNPWVSGPIGERGVAQLHPRSKRGKKSRFVQSARYRKKCESIPGNCQDKIIMAAADHIRSAIDKCGGNEALGVSMYNTGRCEPRWKYIRKVNYWYAAFTENRRAKTLRWCSSKKKKNRFLRIKNKRLEISK
jgi:hypothetical protein